MHDQGKVSALTFLVDDARKRVLDGRIWLGQFRPLKNKVMEAISVLRNEEEITDERIDELQTLVDLTSEARENWCQLQQTLHEQRERIRRSELSRKVLARFDRRAEKRVKSLEWCPEALKEMTECS